MTIDDEKTADEVEVIAEDPVASTEDSVQPPEPEAITNAPEKAVPQGRAGASFVALFAGGLVAGFIGFGLGRIDQTSGWIFPAEQCRSSSWFQRQVAQAANGPAMIEEIRRVWAELH